MLSALANVLANTPKLIVSKKLKVYKPAQTITFQLNDKPELSPYFPDGTLCHQDDSGSKYYCQVFNSHHFPKKNRRSFICQFFKDAHLNPLQRQICLEGKNR